MLLLYNAQIDAWIVESAVATTTLNHLTVCFLHSIMEITDLPNLASAQLGTKIVFATDEWFAAAGERSQM